MAEAEVTSIDGCEVRHGEVKIEGGSLHYAHCGPEDGPLVINIGRPARGQIFIFTLSPSSSERIMQYLYE